MINILLEEYKVLKMEQLERIKFRDLLVYISLGTYGAFFSYILASDNTEYKFISLVFFPIICLILAWLYVANDEKVSQIGDYIITSISPKVKMLVNTEPNTEVSTDFVAFGWEETHRNDVKRKFRKSFQLYSDLLLFVAPPIVSTIINFYSKKMTAGIIFFDAIIILIIAGIFLVYNHPSTNES